MNAKLHFKSIITGFKEEKLSDWIYPIYPTHFPHRINHNNCGLLRGMGHSLCLGSIDSINGKTFVFLALYDPSDQYTTQTTKFNQF